MRLRIAFLLLLGAHAYAKSTFTPPAAPLAVDKSAFRWRPDRQGGGFILDVVISDASVPPTPRNPGDLATRNVEITTAGKVLINGTDTKIALPATFLQALSAFGAAIDKLVDSLTKAGKVKL